MYVSRTAERRNTFGEVLSTVPAEIYMTIFDEIQPSAPNGSFNETLYKETLASLTLVCHHFRDLCQGRMFRHLRFYGFAAKEPDSTSKQIVGRRSWREALAARDPSCVALSDCVKLVTLSSWTSTSKPWTVDQPYFTQLLAQNILSLNALRSLQEVHLVDCLVSGPVLDGLAHIPELVTVEIKDCTISSEYHPTDYSLLDRKGWTTLWVNGIPITEEKKWAGDWTMFSQRLVHLVDRKKLQHLSADRYTDLLLTSLFDQGDVTVTELQTLEIGGPTLFLPEISTLLSKHLPNARSLRTIKLSQDVPQERLSIAVEMLGPMQFQHLSCTIVVGIWARDDLDEVYGVSELHGFLKLWNPSAPVGLSFSFPTLIVHDLEAAIIQVVDSIFKLFARCKARSHMQALYTDPDTLRIKVGRTFTSDGVRVGPFTPQHETTLGLVDVSRLLDSKLDDICPNLDYISVTGLVRSCELRRAQRGERVWRSVV